MEIRLYEEWDCPVCGKKLRHYDHVELLYLIVDHIAQHIYYLHYSEIEGEK